jgi:hypothetical protein
VPLDPDDPEEHFVADDDAMLSPSDADKDD